MPILKAISYFLESWILLVKACLGNCHAYQKLLLVSFDSVNECVLWKRNSCGETWWSIDCLILRFHGRILVARGPTHEYPLPFHKTSRHVGLNSKNTRYVYKHETILHTNIAAHILHIVTSWCTFLYKMTLQKHRVFEASRCLKTLRLLLAPALDRCKAPGFLMVNVSRERSKRRWNQSSFFKILVVKCDLWNWIYFYDSALVTFQHLWNLLVKWHIEYGHMAPEIHSNTLKNQA